MSKRAAGRPVRRGSPRQASARWKARHVDQMVASAEVPLRPVEKGAVIVRLLGGLAITDDDFVLFAAGTGGKGVAPKAVDSTPSWRADGTRREQPNVQAEVGAWSARRRSRRLVRS